MERISSTSEFSSSVGDGKCIKILLKCLVRLIVCSDTELQANCVHKTFTAHLAYRRNPCRNKNAITAFVPIYQWELQHCIDLLLEKMTDMARREFHSGSNNVILSIFFID